MRGTGRPEVHTTPSTSYAWAEPVEPDASQKPELTRTIREDQGVRSSPGATAPRRPPGCRGECQGASRDVRNPTWLLLCGSFCTFAPVRTAVQHDCNSGFIVRLRIEAVCRRGDARCVTEPTLAGIQSRHRQRGVPGGVAPDCVPWVSSIAPTDSRLANLPPARPPVRAHAAIACRDRQSQVLGNISRTPGSRR